MIHYYERVEGKTRNDAKTYCGLFVLNIIEDVTTNDAVDHTVLVHDIIKEEICPKCAKHPNIQMQILKVTEL